MVLVPLFGVADFLMYPEHFPAMMRMRALSAALSALLLFSLSTRLGRQRPIWIAAGLVMQTGVAICAYPVYLTGTDTPHYVSASLLLLSISALLPWTPQQVGALTAAVVVAFALAGRAHGRMADRVAFGTQAAAITVAGTLSVIVSQLADRTRRREFAARRDLKHAGREQRKLIRRQEEMTARLATANEDLEERQRETNDFLYVLSHDLRAPLINIQGFGRRLDADMGGLQAALEGLDGEEAARRLQRMQQSLQYLHAGSAKIDQLISRLLEIARLSTRPGRQEWVDSDELVRHVVASCAYQLQRGGIEVEIGLLPRVWADAVQLSQVFANLFDNAIKYMGDGPRRQISVSCSTQGDRYRFAVRDTGCGIAPKDQEKIFRLFARASASGGAAGEGVGLAAVRAIVNRHGGRIWVESAPGAGSTFYFTLPRAPSAAGQEADSGASPAGPAIEHEERSAHV